VEGRAARRVFGQTGFVIVTTEDNVAEVLEYLPKFAARSGVAEEVLLDVFEVLPIAVYSRRRYSSHIFAARALMASRDPDDVPLAALALKLGIPVWSNDRDFENFPNGVYTTARLIKLLGV
jgi:predicted nucleic acid-binding protein